MAAKRRTKQLPALRARLTGTSTAPLARPTTTVVMMPDAPRRRGFFGGRRRMGGGARQESGWGLVKSVGGLSAGGALGTAVQGSVQGMGFSPIGAKAATLVGAWLLGRGAPRDSMSAKTSDGMVASVGGGFIYDVITWWKERGKGNSVDGMISQLKNMTAAQRAELMQALQAQPTK